MSELPRLPSLKDLTLTPEQMAILSLLDQVTELRKEVAAMKDDIAQLKARK